MKNKIQMRLGATMLFIACMIIQTTVKGEKKVDFPKDFLWSSASAAYQVGGGAKTDGRGPNVWDKYLNPPYSMPKILTGKEANGDVTDIDFETRERIPKQSYYWYESFLRGQKK